MSMDEIEIDVKKALRATLHGDFKAHPTESP
jgi:hypothetical protein